MKMCSIASQMLCRTTNVLERSERRELRVGCRLHVELIADEDAIARVEGVEGPADAEFGDETHQHQWSDLRTRNVLFRGGRKG